MPLGTLIIANAWFVFAGSMPPSTIATLPIAPAIEKRISFSCSCERLSFWLHSSVI